MQDETRRVSYVRGPNPNGTANVWTLVGVAYLASFVTIVSALLPRNDPVRWPWFFAAMACFAVDVGWAFIELRKTARTKGAYAPSPRVTLCIICGGIVSSGIFGIAMSGPFGVYRPLLLLSLLVAAAVGNRRMVIIASIFALTALVVSTLAQGLPLSDLVSFLFAYIPCWGALVLTFHRSAVVGARYVDQTEQFAEMVQVAATATNLADGFERLVPVAAEYLNATHIEAIEIIDGDTIHMLTSWTRSKGERGHEWPDVMQVRRVLTEATLVINDDHVLIPVRPTEGSPVLVAINVTIPGATGRLPFTYAVERVGLQFGVLLSRIRMIERLEMLTRTDGLTGLANRRELMERLASECDDAKRLGHPLVAVMIDLDHFKAYNDDFGHLAGDRMLIESATMIESALRDGDLAARYGGEEFCVVLPATTASEATALLEQMHNVCRRIKLERRVTFSAGVAQWNRLESVDELLMRADQALYLAKAAGRDRTHFMPGAVMFEPESNAQSNSSLVP